MKQPYYYFCNPPLVASAVERLWSLCGNLSQSKRNRILPENLIMRAYNLTNSKLAQTLNLKNHTFTASSRTLPFPQLHFEIHLEDFNLDPDLDTQVLSLENTNDVMSHLSDSSDSDDLNADFLTDELMNSEITNHVELDFMHSTAPKSFWNSLKRQTDELPLDGPRSKRRKLQDQSTEIKIGLKISVFWPQTDSWFDGTIVSNEVTPHVYEVLYNDEEEESIYEVLTGPSREKWKILN